MKEINLEVERGAAVLMLSRCGLGEEYVKRLEAIGYFRAPASSRHHLSCPGGLMVHSMNVANQLVKLEAFDRIDKCLRVGLLHDLVKCGRYASDSHGGFYIRNMPLAGHGVASALIACELGIDLEPDELYAIVWHMGIFDLAENERGPYYEALKLYPRQLVLTHAADHLATLFENAEEVQNG